jgi:hypothetical protein
MSVGTDTGICVVGMDLVQRQVDNVSMTHPALGDNVVGKAPHIGAASLEYGNFHATFLDGSDDVFGTAAIQTTVFDSETVRGRLGCAFDNVFVYATAGWAWSSNQYVRTQLTGALNNATAGAVEAVNISAAGRQVFHCFRPDRIGSLCCCWRPIRWLDHRRRGRIRNHRHDSGENCIPIHQP